MRILLATSASLALVAAGLGAAESQAGSSCWSRLLVDWSSNNRVDGTYPPSCYRAAITNLPEDLRSYSRTSSDIATALQQKLVRTSNAKSATALQQKRGRTSGTKSAAESVGAGMASQAWKALSLVALIALLLGSIVLLAGRRRSLRRR